MSEGDIVEQVDKAPRFGLRHLQILLLFLNIVVTYMGRLSISIDLVAMTNPDSTNTSFEGFDWTEKQKSYIMSSFFWGFVCNQFTGSYLSRRFGSKLVLFFCTLGSAICSLLIPFLVPSGGWHIFCVLRAVQGFIQAPLFPSIQAHVVNWSTPAERNIIGEIIYSAIDCGIVLAVLVGGLIASGPFGWPGISYISAVIGFAWCLLWLSLAADDPASARFITKEECQCIEMSNKRNAGVYAKKIPIPWYAMLTSGPFIALLIVRCAESWGFSTIQSQTPAYYNGVLNMDMKWNALFSALPYIVRWIASYTFYLLGSMAVRKCWLSMTAMSKITNTMAFWLPALLLIAIGFLDNANNALAVTLMTLNVGFTGGAVVGCVLRANDLSPNHAAVVTSIVNPVANVMPLITPLVVGILVEDVHDPANFQIVFLIVAVILFVGNMIFILFGSAEVQPWDDADFLLNNSEAAPTIVEPKKNLSVEKHKKWPVANIEHVCSHI